MSQDELQPLSESVGYLLKQATTALHAAMEAALRPLSLSLSQYSCLELLSRTPDQSNAELARGAFVTPQSMNDLLRGLQRRGLVERPAVAPVGRALPTRLTPKGQERVDRARIVLVPVERRLLEGVAEPDRQRLAADLRAIVRAMELGVAGEPGPAPPLSTGTGSRRTARR